MKKIKVLAFGEPDLHHSAWMMSFVSGSISSPTSLSFRRALVSSSVRPQLLHLVLRGAFQLGSPGPPGATSDHGAAGHVLGAALRLPGGGAVDQRPPAHRVHQGGAAADSL